MNLKRYWLKFDLTHSTNLPSGFNLGCGVTAYNYDDAILLIEQYAFRGSKVPPILQVIEDVDVSQLDASHVLPNIGISVRRGVWFPALNFND